MKSEKRTKLMSILLCFTMVIALCGVFGTVTASADGTSLDIASGSILFMEAGSNKTVNMKPYTGSVTITGNHTNNFILINTGEHNVILDNATLPRIMLTSKAKLNLTLVGNNTIDGTQALVPGIYVPNGAQLVISGDSTGTLTVTGASGNAAIGGMQMDISGSITINGGTVIATGGSGAAGIGCADTGETTSIVVNGGNVTATGGSGAAGIGGGSGSNGMGIVISGGTVTAIGGSGADAIGMGIGGSSESVSVFPASGQKIVVKESADSQEVLGEYAELKDITYVVDGKNKIYTTTVLSGSTTPDKTSVEVTKNTDENSCSVKYAITSEDMEKSPVLYVAFYTAQDVFITATVVKEDIVSSEEFTVFIPDGSGKCKVMLWETTLNSLCEADDCDL